MSAPLGKGQQNTPHDQRRQDTIKTEDGMATKKHKRHKGKPKTKNRDDPNSIFCLGLLSFFVPFVRFCGHSVLLVLSLAQSADLPRFFLGVSTSAPRAASSAAASSSSFAAVASSAVASTSFGERFSTTAAAISSRTLGLSRRDWTAFFSPWPIDGPL